MEKINVTQLSNVPYLRCTDDGRIVPLQSYWDGEGWHIWIPDGKGALIKMRPVDCAAGIYVAKEPARETDLHIPFLDFMWKHASWPHITRWLVAIEQDVVKLAAAMAKIEHLEECTSFAHRFEIDIFIATEIEYLFGRCRTLFDNLQQIVAALWETIELIDKADAKQKRKLPDSFRAVAQKMRDVADGEPAPYGLPATVVAAYKGVADFFFSLRELRDKLIHRGGNVGRVFITDRGPAIESRGPLARMSPASDAAHAYNENLISLRPALAHLVCRTVYALNDFGDAFRRVIQFPDAMIPDHALFLRTPHAAALVAAQKILRGASPWKETSASSAGA